MAISDELRQGRNATEAPRAQCTRDRIGTSYRGTAQRVEGGLDVGDSLVCHARGDPTSTSIVDTRRDDGYARRRLGPSDILRSESEFSSYMRQQPQLKMTAQLQVASFAAGPEEARRDMEVSCRGGSAR
jgi:hypothetical protein